MTQPPLIDPFERAVTYLRVSVTDRCDFRCVYCMSEDMAFLPKADILTLEELERLCGAFVKLGVRKLRMTGGEPLVRRNIMSLFRGLGRHIETGGLDELTVTTNASQLDKHAQALYEAGVRRVNVSIDTLDARKFTELTRWGRLEQVLGGIEAAKAAGLKIKLNMVALKGVNDDEFDRMIAWCGDEGFDLTIIEVMLQKNWTLEDSDYRTGGPARYATVKETGGRLGFITPLTHNFCESCNRVRLTCTGTLYMCLGQSDAADLRAPLRASADDDLLIEAIREAITRKPMGHDFVHDRRTARRPAVERHMSVTGG
jgi:cyclic pyranopterin phosphate synthase